MRQKRSDTSLFIRTQAQSGTYPLVEVITRLFRGALDRQFRGNNMTKVDLLCINPHLHTRTRFDKFALTHR